MRVGFDVTVLNRPALSGIGIYIKNILNHTPEQIEAVCFFPYFPGKNYLKKYIKRKVSFQRILCPEFINARRFDFFWYDFLLPFFTQRKKLDIFHGLASFLPDVEKIKKVVTIHDISALVLPREKNYHIPTFFKRVKKSLSIADKVIAVSNFTRKEIIKYFNLEEDRVEVVYEGIEDVFMNSFQKNREEVNREKEPFYLFVGDFYPRKRPLWLIKVFWQIREEEGLDYSLYMVGKPAPFLRDIQDFVKKNNLSSFIKIFGYIPQERLLNFYTHARALILPSIYEGFGLPLLEAMASGCCVISTDIEVFREIGGDAPFYFKPDSFTSFKSALLKSLDNNLQRERILKGFKNIQRFSWEKTLRALLRVYESIL